MERRLAEAARLGFTIALVPPGVDTSECCRTVCVRCARQHHRRCAGAADEIAVNAAAAPTDAAIGWMTSQPRPETKCSCDPSHAAGDRRPAGAGHRAARRPRADPARPHRRADRARLRRAASRPSATAASRWTCATRRPGCASCPRWTAPWCCPPTAAASFGPTCNWFPTRRSPPTSRAPGTGPPNAPRSRPAIPLMSVSHSMSIVTVYVAGERHVVADSATILSRANQAIATLERYKIAARRGEQAAVARPRSRTSSRCAT